MLLPIVGPVKSVPGPKFSFRKILYFLNLLICLDSLGFLLQTFLDLSFGKLLLTSYCARGTTSGAVSPTDVGIYSSVLKGTLPVKPASKKWNSET